MNDRTMEEKLNRSRIELDNLKMNAMKKGEGLGLHVPSSNLEWAIRPDMMELRMEIDRITHER